MTTFYICRHGETENNKKGLLSGWIDTALTKEGVQNAESSAAKLLGIQFDKIISSDLGRALTTAYLISRKLGYTAEIERLQGLRDVNYGDLANMPIASYPELSAAENTNYAPPHGESLAQLQQRVMACIAKLSLESPDKTILLVAHDGTINAVKATFSGQDIGIVDAQSANGHDFVAKFTVADGTVTSFAEV